MTWFTEKVIFTCKGNDEDILTIGRPILPGSDFSSAALENKLTLFSLTPSWSAKLPVIPLDEVGDGDEVGVDKVVSCVPTLALVKFDGVVYPESTLSKCLLFWTVVATVIGDEGGVSPDDEDEFRLPCSWSGPVPRNPKLFLRWS